MTNKKWRTGSFNFAVLVGNVVKGLRDNRMNYHLGGQLIRSGTSPALNYGEARGAESRKDFIHKLGIILKELRETNVSLNILSKNGCVETGDPVLVECDERISIFVKSVQTAKRNTENLGNPNSHS